MRKSIFGAVLFLGGLWVTGLLHALSIIKPHHYDNGLSGGIGGLLGFLLSTNTFVQFCLACIMVVIGINICYQEAYKRKQN